MADEATTTKGRGKSPDDKVAEAVENLRQTMLDRGDPEVDVDAKLWAVYPNQTNLVGNFADLQRLGGQQVEKTGGIADAFVEPPAPPDAEEVARMNR